MTAIVASLIDGIMIGAVYGLAAMGLTLIWGVMDVINLTHGAMIALGMFAVYLLFGATSVSPYALLPLVILGGFAAGVVVYWIAVHRMIGRAPLMSLLATFAVNMIIIGAGTALWSTSPYNLSVAVPGLTWQSLTFPGTHLAATVIAIVLAVLVYGFLHHTRHGTAIRAVASNRDAAELMGIPSARVLAQTFGLGIALAAASGALIATMFPFTILSGSSYELKSFIVTVLGGLGNPIGALTGGFLLGLIEGVVSQFIEVSWIPVIEFALFVLVLLIRPYGLFGKGRIA
jgi:branched-subunit amino acid ABC-type transport system permease component